VQAAVAASLGSDPTSGGSFRISTAQAKALGISGASTHLDGYIGLSSALSGRSDLSAAAPVAGITGLAVLPAGPLPPNPLELLSRGAFAALLARAQAEYDMILIDTPPVTQYADASAITFRAGDALMVSRKDHTRLADTEQAMRDLSDASARVVGSLMNAY